MLELNHPAGDDRTDGVHSSKAWYALRVRARSEQMIAAALAAREVECFAPFWEERRVYSDRLRRLPVAVFPGYICCRVSSPERVRVCSTPGVQCLVGAGRVPEVIEEHVIAGFQKAFSEALQVSPVSYLRSGDLVQVVDGALAGTVGKLLRVKGHLRLVLSVDVLQRSVAVEVDAASVVPFSPR